MSEQDINEARRLLREGRNGDARARLEKVLAENASDPAAVRMLAQLAYADRDFVLARDLLQKLVAANPRRGVYHFELALVYQELNQLEAALAELEAAEAADPGVPAVLVQKGVVLERLGRRYDAAMTFHRLWVKVLQGGQRVDQLAPALQKLVAHGGQLVRAEMKSLLDAALAEVRRQFGGADLSRLEHLVGITLGEASAPPRPPMKHSSGIHFPGLPEMPFHDRARFPWLEEVEAQAARIRDEYLALEEDASIFRPYVSVDAQSPSAKHWQTVNNSTDWNSCHLYRYGELQEKAASRCPVTMETIEKTPLSRVKGHGPESIFSVLKPKTHIPPHHGLVGGRLLVHLPLIVPENCGALRVGNEQHAWEFGRCLVFDDTYRHEAWNNSNETRVVLIFDVWHPDLSDAERHGFAELLRILDQINVDSLGERMLRQ